MVSGIVKDGCQWNLSIAPRNPDVVYTIARLTDMCSRRLESNAVVVLLVKRRIAVRFHTGSGSWFAPSLCLGS